MSCDFPLVVLLASSTSSRFVKLKCSKRNLAIISKFTSEPNLIRRLAHSRQLDMRWFWPIRFYNPRWLLKLSSQGESFPKSVWATLVAHCSYASETFNTPFGKWKLFSLSRDSSEVNLSRDIKKNKILILKRDCFWKLLIRAGFII